MSCYWRPTFRNALSVPSSARDSRPVLIHTSSPAEDGTDTALPKRRSSITTRRLGNTQKNLYHHYNAAKAWNLECYCILPTLCLTSTLKINSPSYLPPERNRITNERWTDNSLYDANVLILIDPNNGGKMHDAHPIYLDAQRIWLSIFMWLSLWRRWFYMFRS